MEMSTVREKFLFLVGSEGIMSNNLHSRQFEFKVEERLTD